ncbi:protein SHQ1 homolog [Apostichopus japonicus]|uniref:protein SHQ1 homolog n=1 Tax=Stichopus japonicus TaxID=307972 RepID=UPI003AB1B048
MLTPAFEVCQEDDFLTLIIKARFARVSETEIFVDGKAFKFYSKPYFLRLTLPGALVEDGRETANYDPEKGTFTIRFPKETPGEKFDGLDMLTQLMAPTGSDSASEPFIEPLATKDEEDIKLADEERQDVKEDEEDEEGEDGDINWEVDQTPCSLDEDEIVGPVKYGFAGRRSGVFSRLQEELSSIVDVPDPDHMTAKEKREARQEEEAEKFDDEHYLADLYEEETIQQLLNYKPVWQKQKKEDQLTQEECVNPSPDLIKFTEAEREQMLKLPRKEFLLDKNMEIEAYMGLLDVIFAYAFNHRSTEGDNSVESAWTICKLSTTLSWLDTQSTPRDVLVSSVRRSLCYPLHRHWELAISTVDDVKTIFHLGRNQILKALLEVHRLLSEDDPRYILNELYITDYCVWLQGQPQEKIQKLALSLDKVKLSKEDVDLDLNELEEAARCVLEEDGGIPTSPPTVEMKGYPHLLQEPGNDKSEDSHSEQSSTDSSESYAEEEESSGEGEESSEEGEAVAHREEGDAEGTNEPDPGDKGRRVVQGTSTVTNSQTLLSHLPEGVGSLSKNMASLMIEKSKSDALDTRLDSDDDSNG